MGQHGDLVNIFYARFAFDKGIERDYVVNEPDALSGPKGFRTDYKGHQDLEEFPFCTCS